MAIMGAILVLVVLIDVGLLIAWAFRKEAADSGLKPPLFAPRWSLVDVWLGGQVLVAILMVTLFCAMFVWTIFGGLTRGGIGGANPMITSPLFLLFLMIAQNALLVVVPGIVITQKYHVPLQEIGLPIVPSRKLLLVGIGLGIVLLIVSSGLDFSLAWIMNQILGPDLMKKLMEWTKALTLEGMLEGKMTWAMYATLLFSAGIAAPIGEEVFFRGFLFNCAKRRFGVGPGIIISAVVFALIHGGPIAVIAIVPMGIFLAYAYEKTGSLWVPIAMHAVNNSVAITIAFVGSRLAH
jgi:hypothetical protein